MARGNETIVTTEPGGRFEEGYVKTAESHYPGMIVQIDPTVALVGGKHTYKIYDRAADGDQPLGAFWVVTNQLNALQGLTMTSAYAAGLPASYYAPQPGEELNLLLLNISGTGDDHTAGEILMVDDGTGKLIATTGSPETEVAVLLETVTDPVADTIAWCQWTGH